MLKSSPSKSALNQSSISKASLAQFDFTTLEENDPVLQGFIPIFDSEICFRIHLTEKDSQSTEFPQSENLRVRVLIQGTDMNLESMKLELSSDNDLFFHFLHKADAASFEKTIQPQQQLYCKFMDYPAVCIKNFEKCIRENQHFIPILTIMPDGFGRVEIVQMTEYKSVELISFDFASSEEEIIRSVITYKYQSVKQKLAQMESKLRDINDVVKIKNPSLLLQIQKSRLTKQK